MSYGEKDGQVVLTMSRADYETLLICLGAAAGLAVALQPHLELMDRLNEGNPNYRPYTRPVVQ